MKKVNKVKKVKVFLQKALLFLREHPLVQVHG